MIFLQNIQALTNQLLTRLTATRAANLDDIDTTVSSRAPSSTALSTATWTSTRAGKIDTIDTNIDHTLLDAVGPVGMPPAALVPSSGASIDGALALAASSMSPTYTTTPITAWTTLLLVSGAGVLNFAALANHSGGTITGGLQIVLDGTTAIFAYESASLYDDYAIVGAGALLASDLGSGTFSCGIAFDQIPFRTSLTIRYKRTGGSGGTAVAAYFAYRTTGTP